MQACWWLWVVGTRVRRRFCMAELHNPHPRLPNLGSLALSHPLPSRKLPSPDISIVLASSAPCLRRRCCCTTLTRGTPPAMRSRGTCCISQPWCGGPPPAWAAAWATTAPCPSRCCRGCTEAARWWCAGERGEGPAAGRQRAARRRFRRGVEWEMVQGRTVRGKGDAVRHTVGWAVRGTGGVFYSGEPWLGGGADGAVAPELKTGARGVLSAQMGSWCSCAPPGVDGCHVNGPYTKFHRALPLHSVSPLGQCGTKRPNRQWHACALPRRYNPMGNQPSNAAFSVNGEACIMMN